MLLESVGNLSKYLDENTYNIVIGGSIVPSREMLNSFKSKFLDLNYTWFASRENNATVDEISNVVENDFRMKLKHLQNKVPFEYSYIIEILKIYFSL